MQAYAVEFLPARRPPLRITDGVSASPLPHPHLVVGESGGAGKSARIPLTARLVASSRGNGTTIHRAGIYRDPKSGRIVLGVEHAPDETDARALVLLAASSSFPDGVSVIPEKTIGLIAQGEMQKGQQLLLIWPDGDRVVVEDPAREERYAILRSGDQFESILLTEGP